MRLQSLHMSSIPQPGAELPEPECNQFVYMAGQASGAQCDEGVFGRNPSAAAKDRNYSLGTNKSKHR